MENVKKESEPIQLPKVKKISGQIRNGKFQLQTETLFVVPWQQLEK